MDPFYNFPNEMDLHIKAANLPEFNPESQHNLGAKDGGASQNEQNTPDTEANTTKSKRTRATPEQLAYLEASFQKNSSPNCKIREVIAQRIGMPERSIQVWFQNRRAKVKVAQRKAHIALREEALHQHFMASQGRQGFDINYMEPPSFPVMASPYLNNDFNSSPLPGASTTFSPYAGSSPYFGVGSPNFSSPNPAASYTGSWSVPQTVSNGIFPCTQLSIGSWHRRAVGMEDMVCGFSLDKNQMAWIVSEMNIKFRICFPFRNISGIELAFTDPVEAELRINLTQPPDFAIFSTPGQWMPCADFTENQQASNCMRHIIKGEAQGLRVQVIGLLHLSQELSTITRILGAASAAQLEARRRQSASIVGNPQGLMPEQLDPTAVGFVPCDAQSMANLALDRAKNRSLSLPTLPHQQPNFNDASMNYHPGNESVDASTSLNNGTFPDLNNLSFSNFQSSSMADMQTYGQTYGQLSQELPPSVFQTPVLPHHFEVEPGFGQTFDPQIQNPPQTSFAYPQSSQFGIPDSSAPMVSSTVSFPSIPDPAPQNHHLHDPIP